MKVFISWSGSLSQKLGEAFRTWLPGAMQLVRPYFTPSDIEKGARWNPEILSELESANVGIFCMTPTNLNSSWMLFEAGALSKRVDKSRICPILFQIDHTSLPSPLSQFQTTNFNQEDIFKLMQTINSTLGDSRLAEKTLESVFEMWWPRLEQQVNKIVQEHSEEGEEQIRDQREMIAEVLDLTRLIARKTTSGGSIHPGAASDILNRFVQLHNSVQNHTSDDQLMKQIHGMKKAIVYFGSLSRGDEIAGLVEIIEGLPFTCNSVDDDIPF